MNGDDKEDSITLGLLGAIEEKSDVTQRHLADRLGVALGLANSYLKRCARKGFIKIHQAPANRYIYYLTPKGFAEKTRLTARYLSTSFDFYRYAGESITHAYDVCDANNWGQILLCGASELAEIASLRALEHDILITGIFDPAFTKNKFLNFSVLNQIDTATQYDVCLLTTLIEPENFYYSLTEKVDKEKILVPSILGFKPK